MWERSSSYFMGTRTITDRALPWEDSWEEPPVRKMRFDRPGGQGEDWRNLENPCYGEIEEIEDELEKRFKLFSNFEVITGHPPADHRFIYNVHHRKEDSEQKIKHMAWETRKLEEELPGTRVYVRAYRNRPDLMRAVIVGSEGTPYRHGLFFFDILIPSNYPSQPPKLVYLYHGIEINPYLQSDGEVSLALLSLGFWDRLSPYSTPHKSQRWNPKKSSILEVLLSIQSSVLKDHSLSSLPIPPNGHEILNHNKSVFTELCKSIIHLLHDPPTDFLVFVAGHFRKRAHSILMMYKEIMGMPDPKDPSSQVFWSLIKALASNGTYCGHHYTPSQLKEWTETSRRKSMSPQSAITMVSMSTSTF